MSAKVLVVDPDQLSGRALELIMRMDRHDVRVASTGREALRMLARPTPDVIIVDSDMLGAEGMPVASLLRRVTQTVPIIVISARPEVSSRLPHSTRLQRPVDAQRLRAVVSNLIGGASRAVRGPDGATQALASRPA